MLSQLHPALVHFPLALLLCAVPAEIYGLWRKGAFWQKAAFWLLFAGTIGAFLAALSGGWAEDALQISKEIHEKVEQHETTGYILAWLYAALLVWKFLRSKQMGRAEQAVFAGAMLAAAMLLIYTGYLGGELVYSYGAGVKGLTVPVTP
ncbi:MAG: DUF2231 domain-containing protein [Bacteroidia bacterium]